MESRPIDTTTPETIQASCTDYLSQRTSDYEFRCRRYDAVIRKMVELGLRNGDSVLDVGCGRQDFKRRLEDWGFHVEYTGVDGSINGVDLNTCIPIWIYDFIVAIEVLEHLVNPKYQLYSLPRWTQKGFVLTTPNPLTVDVLACDPTHISIVRPAMLVEHGYEFDEVSLFGKDRDSLLAWKR